MAQYIWPVPRGTSVNQAFGSSPGGVNPSGGHTGMDFGTEIGTPVYAPADGVIEFAQWFTTDNGSDNPYWLTSGGGISVVLGCDGDDSPSFVFSHLSSTTKNPGDRVKQGDIVGYSGNTGKWTTGPHLHFEVIPPGFNLNSSTYGRVNPARYCDGHLGAIAVPLSSSKPKPIPVKKESEMPKYKRVGPGTNLPLLGKGVEWFLKDKSGMHNENYAACGLGHYGVKLFVQGTGLPAGERVRVKFVLIPTGGKASPYFEQDIHGSADGSFKGVALFDMPILKGARLEASVTATAAAKLTHYSADVATWAK